MVSESRLGGSPILQVFTRSVSGADLAFSRKNEARFALVQNNTICHPLTDSSGRLLGAIQVMSNQDEVAVTENKRGVSVA